MSAQGERSGIPSRAEALDLVRRYTESENLRKHMLAVEAAMRAYAEKYGADADKWGVTGLLHDFDYERWPNEERAPDEGHPARGVEILRDRGVSEEICRAILAHAPYTGVEPETRMARALRAVDDLTGFIVACALVRPNHIMDLEPPSVKKKLGDRSFAAAIDRQELRETCAELGEDFTEHLELVIGAMRGIAEELDLTGQE